MGSMLTTKHVLHLYNGYKIEIQRKSTRLEILGILANYIRLAPELFKFVVVCNGAHLCLPYIKKNIDSFFSGPFLFKLFTSLFDIRDIAYQYPEVLNYLYYQYIQQFRQIFDSNAEIHLEILVLDIALKHSSIRTQNLTPACVELYLKLSSYPSLQSDYVIEMVKKIMNDNHSICHLKCELILKIQKLSFLSPEDIFECEVDKGKMFVKISSDGLNFNRSKRYIPLSDIERVEMNFKRHVAIVVISRKGLQTNEQMIVKLLSRNNMESFITVLDIVYKTNFPSRQILDYKVTDDFLLDSMIYQNHNFQRPDGIFNYSLVDKCKMVMQIKNRDEAEKLLRFVPDSGKFLVSDNHFLIEEERLCTHYLLYFIIRDKVPRRTILDVGGKFKIDEQRSYQSLFRLFSRIELIDRKKNHNKQISKNKEFVAYINEEDIFNMKRTEYIYSIKSEVTISPLNVTLIPSPRIEHYLHQVYYGRMHLDGLIVKCTVLQFTSFNRDYDSFIQTPVIEHVKNLIRKKLNHQNIICFLGVYRIERLPGVIQEDFGVPLSEHMLTRPHNYSTVEIFSLSMQIVSGLLYLHEQDIVHGFAALHNILIVNQTIKLSFIGVLPQLLKRKDIYNPLLSRDYLSCTPSYAHPARWLHRSMVLSNAPWSIEVDRYIFGCTLWQLFNNGAIPLSGITDQEILNKLEGSDCTWYNGGSLFKLPHNNTEFHKKLQKIINVSVTWGSKDNQDKYEFRKIAEAYEKLADVVQSDQHISSDFILKAGDGKLDFDVSCPSMNNFTRTTFSETRDHAPTMNNMISTLDVGFSDELVNVKGALNEKGCLLSITDLQFPDGSLFVPPTPGSKEVEALFTKSSFSQNNVWVKSYVRSKEIPELDFVQEVRNLLQFEHPNIVPLKGCIIQETILLLVTPCYKYGGTLREYLDNNPGSVTERQRELYTRQICSGMKYLADHACVHRNLRLSRVYLTHKTHVVISNFGLARVTDSVFYQQQRHLTSDTFVVYPPEVISVLCTGGKVKFTSCCDVWSFGILIWELYSNLVAYSNIIMDIHGHPDMGLLHQHLSQGYTLEVNEVWSRNVKTVIEKCLSHGIPRLTFHQIEVILQE